MDLATGQLPNNPGIDGTKEQATLSSLLPCTGYIFQNPVQLGTGEISIQNKARLLAEHLSIALGL